MVCWSQPALLWSSETKDIWHFEQQWFVSFLCRCDEQDARAHSCTLNTHMRYTRAHTHTHTHTCAQTPLPSLATERLQRAATWPRPTSWCSTRTARCRPSRSPRTSSRVLTRRRLQRPQHQPQQHRRRSSSSRFRCVCVWVGVPVVLNEPKPQHASQRKVLGSVRVVCLCLIPRLALSVQTTCPYASTMMRVLWRRVFAIL